MALPSSGSISLGAIQTEFGGSNPIGLSEYYQGGSIIGAGVYPNTIPTSGLIQLDDFYSAKAAHEYGGASSSQQVYNAIIGYSIDYFNGSLKLTVGYWGSGNTGSWTALKNYSGSGNPSTYGEIAQFVLTSGNANTKLYATGASGYVKSPCNCIFGNPIYVYGNDVNTSGGSSGKPNGAWMIAAEWNGSNQVKIYLNPSRNGTGDTGTSISMSNFISALNQLNGNQGETVPITVSLTR
jgi:hypothetical protein